MENTLLYIVFGLLFVKLCVVCLGILPDSSERTSENCVQALLVLCGINLGICIAAMCMGL